MKSLSALALLTVLAWPPIVTAAGLSAPMQANSPCMPSGKLANTLAVKAKAGVSKTDAEKELSTSLASRADAVGRKWSSAREIHELVYSFNYFWYSPEVVPTVVALACHYDLDRDIAPLVARAAAACEREQPALEHIVICAEQVLLGISPK